MKPHSLRSAGYLVPPTREQQLAKLGPHARRFGDYPKGTVLPETQVIACPRVKMKDMPRHIPARYYESNLEHNQLAKLCCRHVEEHEVEARKSHPDEELPDIYVFYCTSCGRKHVRWFVSDDDREMRPMWDAS